MTTRTVALYSPLEPTLVGGIRTWLLDFWKPYVTSRAISLRFIHTGTRPATDPNAYRELDDLLNVTFVRIPGKTVPGSGALLPTPRALAEQLEGANVLYVDNGYAFQDAIAVTAARRAGVKSISGHHSVILHTAGGLTASLHNAMWSLIGRRVLRHFDRTHALSAADASYLRSIGAPDVRIAHLPIDTETFTSGAKAPRKTVLYAGRFHAQKGIDVLAETVRELLARNADLEFRIIGAGPERATLDRLAAHPRVTLLPPMQRHGVAAEMRAAHVLISPSRAETFGFVVGEALASGTPVVCTPTNGYRDLTTATSSILMPFDATPQAWADAVERICGLPDDEYTAMSDAARAAGLRFAFAEVAAQFDELLAFD